MMQILLLMVGRWWKEGALVSPVSSFLIVHKPRLFSPRARNPSEPTPRVHRLSPLRLCTAYLQYAAVRALASSYSKAELETINAQVCSVWACVCSLACVCNA